MISKLNPDTKEFLDCVKTFIVFNSSESAHICKDKRYFCGDILPINLTSGIKKIGGTDFKPSSIGTVKWYWQDDDGRNHEFILEKVLYFTNSPVHILSIEALSDGFDKNEGAWIHTKEKASVFKWNQEIFVQHFGIPPHISLNWNLQAVLITLQMFSPFHSQVSYQKPTKLPHIGHYGHSRHLSEASRL